MPKELFQIKQEGEERAVLAALLPPQMSDADGEANLAELAELARTAGAVVVNRVMQRKDRPDPATYLGEGKIEELKALTVELTADVIIFDDELTPAQKRNLENLLDCKVLDRTQLILDIFAQRARTKEGKLQVELAQLQYLLPRLTGKGVELSRLGGGIGTRGPGETKLEVDRRRIRERMAVLRRELEEVKAHRTLQREGRKRIPYPLVAMVGYTNAGKSSTLNFLTRVEAFGVEKWLALPPEEQGRALMGVAGAGVLAEDKLFATLDPTTRKITLPGGQEFLLTDTVGFIQKLPHHLVAAFRATLEEVVEADLILHMVDASHPRRDEQMAAVAEVLRELKAAEKPVLTVYNKADLLSPGEIEYLRQQDRSVVFSAVTGEYTDRLLTAISRMLTSEREKLILFIPYRESGVISRLFQIGRVLNEEHQAHGTRLVVELTKRHSSAFKQWQTNE